MKKQLLALSLIATSGLIADSRSSNVASSSSDPCCEPVCCVPKPKKCIDCECYNPQFYDLQCDCGFFGSVDFLYWYARETNLTYGLEVVGTAKSDEANADVVFAPNRYRNLDTQWDPGFRVGIGWNDGCDGWDYTLMWTYIHNKNSSKASVDSSYSLNGDILLPGVGQSALLDPWVNPGLFPTVGGVPQNLAPLTFDRIRARWEMNLNWIDLQIGRKFWTSPCFTIRPYSGIRGLWDRRTFRTDSTRTVTAENETESMSITLKNRFKTRDWGVGILGGLQPTWYFCPCVGLYGDFTIALLWGEFEIKKSESAEDLNALSGESINYSASGRTNFYQMTPMLSTGLYLSWEDNWCCDQYRSTLLVGWEHHVLFDQNHRAKELCFFASQGGSVTPQSTGFTSFSEATGNLGMGGLVIRLKVDF